MTMKIFDTHVHIDEYAKPEPGRLLKSMDAHGVDRTVLLSEEPFFFGKEGLTPEEWNSARLARLMEWTKTSGGRLLPVYYIDPTEPDAADQADRAIDAGAIGFKVICETFFPGDDRAMPVYQHIADAGKAILFHSGILWDYGNNGNYNRPCNWECMFDISGIRFALAHISWPWCDECISLYGKFSAMSYSPRYKGQKMYIDMTPGTPTYYRQKAMDALYSVFSEGYEYLDKRLLFGSDSFTGDFDAFFQADLAAKDLEKLQKAGFTTEAAENIICANALEFWGIK